MAVDTTKNLNQSVQESFVRANPDASIYGPTGQDRPISKGLYADRYNEAKGYLTREYAPEIFTNPGDEARRAQANASVQKTLAERTVATTPAQEFENEINGEMQGYFQEETARSEAVPTFSGEVVSGPTSGVVGALESAKTMIEGQRESFLDIEAQFATGERPQMSFEQAYRALMEEQGITADQASLRLIQQDIRDAEARLRERVQAQMGEGQIPLGVIAGRVGEVERQEMQRIDYLRRQEKNTSDRLNQKLGIVNDIMKYKGVDYENAVADYEDKYNKAMTLFKTTGEFARELADIDIKIAQEEERIAQEKDKEKKAMMKEQLDMYKLQLGEEQKMRDDARANMQILYNNIASGGISIDQLTNQEKGEWALLEMQAGFPVGTFMNMMAKNNGFEMLTNTTRFDGMGNKYLDVVMRNPRTGEMRVQTTNLGFDAEKALSMQNTASIIDERTLKTLRENEPTEGSYESLYKGSIPGSPHANGWDLDGNVGDPVYSPVGGRVVSVKTEAQTGGKQGWGNQVTIEDDAGNRITLNHLDQFGVNVGDYVYSGQVVATMGKTGKVIPISSDGSHLDITMYRPNGSMMTLSQVKKYIKDNYNPTVTKLSVEDAHKEIMNAIAMVQSGGEVKTAIRSGDTSFGTIVRSSYGTRFLSPDEYIGLRKSALESGITMQDFDKKYNMYTDPAKISEYQLTVLPSY